MRALRPLAVAGIALVALGGPGIADAATGWKRAAPMSQPRYGHTATTLNDGRVLVAGGWSAGTGAELYDPRSGTWSSAGSMAESRYQHAAALLPDGRVLVAGGFPVADSSSPRSSAEVYDPATNTWSGAGTMAVGRSEHAATALGNGKVLVTGGFAGGGATTAAELYDPATNGWSSTGSMAHRRWALTATLLADGKVLAAGGTAFEGSPPPTAAELYDPATGSWSPGGTMATARNFASAALLADGRVVVSGGRGTGAAELRSAELYDPVANAWTNAADRPAPHVMGTSTRLADGTVLVLGSGAFIYDPTGNAWASANAPEGIDSQDHAAAQLPNGDVLVTGGGGAGTDAALYVLDREAPRATLAGKTAQKAGGAITVVVNCTSVDDDCIAAATGKLSVPGAARVYALRAAKPLVVRRGRRATLRLLVPRKARAAATRALRSRRTVRATITVTVGDAAGNTTSLKRRVRLRR